MRFFGFLQDRFGCTRSEVVAVLFLSSTFLAGLGVRWIGGTGDATDSPAYSYAVPDSVFAARSRNPVAQDQGKQREPRPPKLRTSATGERIDINAAAAEELVRLPGIGAGLAERIIAYRTEHGPFRSADELAGVRGIGKKKLDRMRAFIEIR